MKLPYDKNHAVNLCRKMLPAVVVGCTGCECVFSSVCVAVCVLASVCVPGRLMKCVRNSVRIVDRSGVHSRPLQTKLAHTHTHTDESLLEIWYFPIFIAFGASGMSACQPACLFAFYDGNANNNWRKFLSFHSFFHFFFILANRKLLKCHTDISYSMQIYVYILYNTYLYISLCVWFICPFSHPIRGWGKWKICKWNCYSISNTHTHFCTLLFHLHADEDNLKI